MAEDEFLPPPFYDSLEGYQDEMAKTDEILAKVIDSSRAIKDLKLRLYGEENDKGDIPTIRDQLEKLNGKVQNHDKLFANLRLIGIIVVLVLGSIGGITKFFNVW